LDATGVSGTVAGVDDDAAAVVGYDRDAALHMLRVRVGRIPPHATR
jgi:hypothetical protein